jgi:hypothetical protein
MSNDALNLVHFAMSFGRPPSINVGFTPTPPDRGSFPLDHYGLPVYYLVISAVFNVY